jgi:hypothetical protein
MLDYGFAAFGCADKPASAITSPVRSFITLGRLGR